MKKLILVLLMTLSAQQASAFVEGEFAYPEFYGDRIGQVSRDEISNHCRMVINEYGDYEPLYICTDKEISKSLKQLLKLTKRKSKQLHDLMEDAADTGQSIRVQYFKGNPPLNKLLKRASYDGTSCLVDAAVQP